MPALTSRRPRTALVLLAAGDGRRAGHDTNKVLLPLAGRRVFTWSVRWAATLPEVGQVVLVIRDADRQTVTATLARELPDREVSVVTGGSSRHESEWLALTALRPAIDAGLVDVVVIHDAARPLAPTALFRDVVTAAVIHGGALPVTDQTALVHRDPAVGAVPARTVAVQTPQAFRAIPLLEAYTAAHREGFVGTDTASCVERYAALRVHCVAGDARNIKITYPEDLFLAERLLAKAGYDLTETDRSPAAEPARRRRPLLSERRR